MCPWERLKSNRFIILASKQWSLRTLSLEGYYFSQSKTMMQPCPLLFVLCIYTDYNVCCSYWQKFKLKPVMKYKEDVTKLHPGQNLYTWDSGMTQNNFFM